MRAILQRVSRSKVTVDGRTTGEIGLGLALFLGVRKGDTTEDAEYLLDRVIGLRIFPDADGKMNLSLADSGGTLLVVSQFTLYGDTKKGRRPGFEAAAPPEIARALYEHFVAKAREKGLIVQTGEFQATMSVELVNEGPVTFIVESKGG